MMTDAQKKYLLGRLRDGDTYTMLVALLTLAGVALSPAQKQEILTIGGVIASLVHGLFPDLNQKGIDHEATLPPVSK
jgi:hypothetical protein